MYILSPNQVSQAHFLCCHDLEVGGARMAKGPYLGLWCKVHGQPGACSFTTNYNTEGNAKWNIFFPVSSASCYLYICSICSVLIHILCGGTWTQKLLQSEAASDELKLAFLLGSPFGFCFLFILNLYY